MIQPSRLFILLLCIYLLRVCVSCLFVELFDFYCFVGRELDIFVISKPVCIYNALKDVISDNTLVSES